MTFTRQILGGLAQFVLVVVIARELGPEGNGMYAMVILLPNILLSFLNLGIGSSTIYYLGRKEFDVCEIVACNIKMALKVAIWGIFIALVGLSIWGEKVFPDVPLTLLYMSLASFPLGLLLTYLNSVFQGLEDFKVYNFTILLPPYVNLVAVAVVFYIFDLGISGALIASIFSQFFGLSLVLIFLYRYNVLSINSYKNSVLSNYPHRSIKYGWKSHLSDVLTFVNYRADIFLVNLFLNPTATGVYVIAVQIAERLWILSQAVGIVLFPRLSAMQSSPQGRLDLTNKSFILVLLLTSGLSGFVAIALYWLIEPLFGEAYADTWLVFMWLLPGIIALAGSRIYSNSIAAAGKPEWNAYVALGIVCINITGNVILIPKYGIIGAAIATSLSYCFDAAVKTYLIRRTLYII